MTISHAVQTVVLSLAGLRRLRFQKRVDGKPIPAAERDAAETAARTALAALALAGVIYQRNNGFDLRSRSMLIATAPLTFEVLGRDGGEPRQYTVEDAAALLAEAVAAAGKLGLGWEAGPVTLKPTPKLSHLILKSRELVAAGESEETD